MCGNSNPILITYGQNINWCLQKTASFVSTPTFNYVEISYNPFFLLFTDIRNVLKHAPCGKLYFYGMGFDCDCKISEFLHLGLKPLEQYYIKDYFHIYCRSPADYHGIYIKDLITNNTLRDTLTCKIDDYCPTVGDCKCHCFSNPYRNAIVDDCSNQSCQGFPEAMPHDIKRDFEF